MDERALLRRMFDAAVAAARRGRVALPICRQPPSGRTIVVGAGKAAAAMARAVEAHWPRRRSGSRRHPLRPWRADSRASRSSRPSHPVPDAAGQAAAARILDRHAASVPTISCFA